jgi:hypothetical protein
MRKALRLLALIGTTLFGVTSVAQIVVLVYTYIETYRLPPPPFPIPSYHRFPIYRVIRDLRDTAPIVFAFICCLILYLTLVRSERPSKEPTAGTLG